MDCTRFDWKGYALGELSSTETAACERHAPTCEQCSAELARYRATVASLRSLPSVEPPRRIVFVPEPLAGQHTSWWQRMWQPSPQLGFASAAVLAVAIVAHGLMARVPAAPASTPMQAAQINARIHEEAREEARIEVNRLLPQAVNAALKTTLETKLQSEIQPAFASLQHQLSQDQHLRSTELEQRRDADQKAVRYAFERLERRVNYAMLSSTRAPGGE